MAPGGVTYALQESCSALRSYSAGGLHRSSAQFIRQSEHYNIGTLQQTVRHRYKWRTARHYRRRLQRKARSS